MKLFLRAEASAPDHAARRCAEIRFSALRRGKRPQSGFLSLFCGWGRLVDGRCGARASLHLAPAHHRGLFIAPAPSHGSAAWLNLATKERVGHYAPESRLLSSL